MNMILGGMEEILDLRVSGFHQYILEEPARLAFASRNLCDMLGCAQEELSSKEGDPYALFVHPADREIYADFLQRSSRGEQTLSAQYRIVCKDGSVRYVSDTMSAKRLETGALVGSSTLTDITPIKTENSNLHFLNQTIPCGFLRYTCEKHPKVTYINEQMLDILRFPEVKDGEFDYLEMYRDNIYMMIPMEERRRFAHFLEKVYAQDTPVSGEITILRCDGTKARVYGWVTKCVGESGQEEFQSVCMDVTERYRSARLHETERYLSALTEIYDKIFEYDFSAGTVKCLYGQRSDTFRWLQDIPMQLEEATEKWVVSSVVGEDKQRVLDFFRDYFRPETRNSDSRPPQTRYRALSSSGEEKTYAGIFLKIDQSVSLYCCRSAEEERQTDTLRSENDSLRSLTENMQELMMRFTDGIVAFEVENGRVRPLYASDNVCVFFGYTKEEWIAMTQKSHSIREFVSRSDVDYEDFMELFENGEAEFEYIDIETQTPRRIRAVCSHMFSGNSSRQYVMLYNADGGEKNTGAEQSQIYIRTFGYFDVFVNEKPIAFRNEKSKELFALLVDRRGGYITSEEAIGFLWEDESVNPVTLARSRKVALRLKNILEEYGISDVVESVNGRRRIVMDRVKCDLYDYLTRREEFSQLFKGSYLTNYSWAETTLGELLDGHAF